ncbi:hypothetical protein VHTUMSATKI_12930 [Vibrio harveyi]
MSVFGVNNSLRKLLVDTVIGGYRKAARILAFNIASEPGLLKFFEKTQNKRIDIRLRV